MNSETIAIIGGAGELGFGLALRWAGADLDVRIGSRDVTRAKEAAARVAASIPGASASGYENAEAAAGASVVIIAVPFSAQASILKGLKGVLNDKIVVDASVPLAAAVGGRPTRMLSVWEGSAAQQAQGLLAGVTVLSAFHNVSAEVLSDLSATPDCDVLICGDDAKAKERLAALVTAIPGLRPLDGGALEMSRVVESITALQISLNRRYKVHGSGIRITGVK